MILPMYVSTVVADVNRRAPTLTGKKAFVRWAFLLHPSTLVDAGKH
jgi:hypothetical protein